MGNETLPLNGIVLENLGGPLETETTGIRSEVDRRIRYFLEGNGSDHDPLTSAMQVAVLGTGKRMRPLLLMLVARDLGCSSPALLDAACAVEFVHAASLVLDDMPCMDNARLRRGKPALHIQFGENVAILASVGLLSRAFYILAQIQDIFPAMRTQLIGALAEAIGSQGLIRGQFQDLHGGPQRSVHEIAMTNQLKTGVLLGLSVEMAAIIARADERVLDSLRAFAIAAGHAFQINDDLKDVPGNDSAVTGKDVGLDEGKATLGAALGINKTQSRLAQHLRDADCHLTDALGSKQRTRRLVGNLFRKNCSLSDSYAP